MSSIRQRFIQGKRIPSASSSTARIVSASIAAAAIGILGAPNASAAPDEVWDRLAHCEASGNWHINTGNGFSGGLQFTPSTWRAFGGSGSAHNASREEQIRVAENVLKGQGWGAWPACSKKLGLRGIAPTDRSDKPKAAPQAIAAGFAPNTYVVKPGDTLGKIAAAHGTTWRAIYEKNPGLTDPHRIFPGNRLNV